WLEAVDSGEIDATLYPATKRRHLRADETPKPAPHKRRQRGVSHAADPPSPTRTGALPPIKQERAERVACTNAEREIGTMTTSKKKARRGELATALLASDFPNDSKVKSA